MTRLFLAALRDGVLLIAGVGLLGMIGVVL
jgi:hypothetical protein